MIAYNNTSHGFAVIACFLFQSLSLFLSLFAVFPQNHRALIDAFLKGSCRKEEEVRRIRPPTGVSVGGRVMQDGAEYGQPCIRWSLDFPCRERDGVARSSLPVRLKHTVHAQSRPTDKRARSILLPWTAVSRSVLVFALRSLRFRLTGLPTDGLWRLCKKRQFVSRVYLLRLLRDRLPALFHPRSTAAPLAACQLPARREPRKLSTVKTPLAKPGRHTVTHACNCSSKYRSLILPYPPPDDRPAPTHIG